MRSLHEYGEATQDFLYSICKDFFILWMDKPQALQTALQPGTHLSWCLPLWLRRSCPAKRCLLALHTEPFTSDNPIADSLLAARAKAVYTLHVVLQMDGSQDRAAIRIESTIPVVHQSLELPVLVLGLDLLKAPHL